MSVTRIGAIFLVFVISAAEQVSPVQKAIQLLGDLQTKLIKDGQDGMVNFETFSRWCQTTSQEKQFSLKDMSEQIVTLKASSEDATSNIEQLSAVIVKLTSEISSAE